MNHQGLPCNLHCDATVVLREQLNFKGAVVRSKRSSCCGRKSQLVVSCQVVTNPWCGLALIFCSFISHLIGHETINIPEIFSGVHGFTGTTVTTLKFVGVWSKHLRIFFSHFWQSLVIFGKCLENVWKLSSDLWNNFGKSLESGRNLRKIIQNVVITNN